MKRIIKMKYLSCLVVAWAALIFVYLNNSGQALAKRDTNQTGNGPQQPLANLDKILSQFSGAKVDPIVDNKLAANVTNVLNEMATSLSKMFMENRRLTSQLEETMRRVQNATGMNATNAIGSIQQQMANMSSLGANINLSTLVPRFQ